MFVNVDLMVPSIGLPSLLARRTRQLGRPPPSRRAARRPRRAPPEPPARCQLPPALDRPVGHRLWPDGFMVGDCRLAYAGSASVFQPLTYVWWMKQNNTIRQILVWGVFSKVCSPQGLTK